MAPDDLGFEQADDGFGEGIIVAVAEASDRGLDPGLGQPFRVPDADVLPASVAMMGQAALRRAAVMQRLFQGIEDKACMSRPRDPPADNAAGEDVDDEGDVHKALPGGHKGEIRHPQHVRTRRPELPVHLVRRTGRGLVGDRGPDLLAADDTAQPIRRISRSTVQRATAMPSRPSCRQTLRAP
jgi:hypothetical protein